jgi:hypothetical protein
MRENSSYMALLRPTRLLSSEKSATYTIKWSYTIIWQVRVDCFSKFLKYFEYFEKRSKLTKNSDFFACGEPATLSHYFEPS